MAAPQAELIERSPTLDEYLQLTDAVGWARYVTRDTARIALANSLYSVVAERGGHAVGMARIIGDGALFFYVQDVAVHPDAQGQGIGEQLMQRLMGWLDRNAPARACVGLFSALGKAPFYERHGFGAAPPERPGMLQHLRLPRE